MEDKVAKLTYTLSGAVEQSTPRFGEWNANEHGGVYAREAEAEQSTACSDRMAGGLRQEVEDNAGPFLKRKVVESTLSCPVAKREKTIFSAKKTPTMDALETFDAAARELMLRHGMIASKLLKRLRNITVAASKDLLPLQVLYNRSSSYGYGFSSAFERFIDASK